MRQLGYYILDAEHHIVPVDVLAWARWFENIDQRKVDRTEIDKEIFVSTVFLGLDHRFIGEGPPLVFETMIFGGEFDSSVWRYSSWDDAVAGHAAAVRKAKKHEPTA